MIRGVYHHTSTSIKHVMRCRIPSTTSNDAAAAISCIWDTVLSSGVRIQEGHARIFDLE